MWKVLLLLYQQGSQESEKLSDLLKVISEAESDIYFLIFYLFIETQREREAETQAEGEAGTMQREPDVGLNPGSPGSCPGLQAALNRCTTRAAQV